MQDSVESSLASPLSRAGTLCPALPRLISLVGCRVVCKRGLWWWRKGIASLAAARSTVSGERFLSSLSKTKRLREK
ncbi:hypothetical protein CBR_g8860 [Chara braunii]|uniref:Uncharacterized protein n=1 Tax=Chara braunii TaxID=69332 RepID=A0A388KN35_CHABU|nr:hypothetical protein CBR_g8860 [Chara braunii]|eukprot:GBG71441.1 hypothetical protein CBR_g8860 [Chara braunii]